MKIKLLLLTTLFFLNLNSCTESVDVICTQEYVYGLSISFVDAVSTNKITTNVQVVAKEGGYEETLITIDSLDSFFGAGERSGTYIITVTSDDYETFISEPITVTSDVCHVIGQEREFILQSR